MKNFKDYYKFPLQKCSYSEAKVYTSDGRMAFDFPYTLIYPNSVNVSGDDKSKIIDIINGGEARIKNDYIFKYEKGEVTLNDKLFIVVRGWGMLIGVGGYKLPPEEASRIQDEFGNYIVEKLNQK